MGKRCALLKGSTEHSDGSLASFQRLQTHLKRAVITPVSCDGTCAQTCLGENPFISLFRTCVCFANTLIKGHFAER